MTRILRRRGCLTLIVLALACSSDIRTEPAGAGQVPSTPDPFPRQGIDGCNCAGAAPVMTAPDGNAHVFQSIVAYYYRMLQAFWTTVAGQDVLTTWLPPAIEQTSEAFYAWQAKSVQIYRDRGLLGFAHRYYGGIFGFLEDSARSPGVCSPALGGRERTTGMLAHVGLSQAGVCGENDDGTTRFWQVNGITLLLIGDVVDAYDLVAAGIAHAVELAPAGRCILPASAPLPLPAPSPSSSGPPPAIPCRVALRDDAVTEAVVLAVPSSAEVAGVALAHRPFTAAGTRIMPNQLDQVRTVLRSDELRAMYAIGAPAFVPEPAAGPTQVRLIGHAIGPAIAPSSLLLPDERSWVDATVGRYTERCCRMVCESPAAGDGLRGEHGAADDRELIDAGVPDAPVDGGGSGASDGGASDAGSGSGSGGSGTGSGSSGSDSGGGNGGSGGGNTGDGNGGGGGGSGSGTLCTTVCMPEGSCQTASATTGMVVMVSSVTSKECFGSCPEPASHPPSSEPVCAP